MQKTENRGGSRPGAGRPRSGIKRSVFSTRLRQEAIDRLKAYAEEKEVNVSSALEDILLRGKL